MERRTFLQQGLGASVAAVLVTALDSACLGRNLKPSMDACSARSLTGTHWAAAAALQDLLLPSAAGSPGARDVNATGYLDAVLRHPDVEPAHLPLVTGGLQQLQALAAQRGGPWTGAPRPRQEELLREFLTTDTGEAVVTTVLVYTLEAFLGDPAYGINPAQVGWAWVGHTPGFPRPRSVDPRGCAPGGRVQGLEPAPGARRLAP